MISTPEELREYIVTLKRYEDLELFYTEMEEHFGNGTIPNRGVEVINKRPISRNTHYLMSENEAEKLRLDDRVLSVNLSPKELGAVITPLYATQYSNHFNKGSGVNNFDDNWGLFRCANGKKANWGQTGVKAFANFTNNTSGNFLNSRAYQVESGSVNITNDGRNVDVIIADGLVSTYDQNFWELGPEFTQERVVQYNWFNHYEEVNGSAYTGVESPVYSYFRNWHNEEFFGDGSIDYTNDDHGTHVAGTACGRIFGWAKSANIYNIYPYGDDTPNTQYNFSADTQLFDYVRAFHKNKPVNPVTKVKNPTIVNCSFAWMFGSVPIHRIEQVIYNNEFYIPASFPSGLLRDAGVAGGWRPFQPDDPEYVKINFITSAFDADVEDATADGIIVVAAAGNEGLPIDVTGGAMWDNEIYVYGAWRPIHRGASPNSSRITKLTKSNKDRNIGDTTCILVGAMSANNVEGKTWFSNTGPAITVFAPGENIQSCTRIPKLVSGSDDYRWIPVKGGSMYVDKYNGTSMASPQVCGMLACALETYPNMNTKQAFDYIHNRMSTSGDLDPNGLYINTQTPRFSELLGAPNLVAKYYMERQISGAVYPKNDYWIRPTSGCSYPRRRARY